MAASYQHDRASIEQIGATRTAEELMEEVLTMPLEPQDGSTACIDSYDGYSDMASAEQKNTSIEQTTDPETGEPVMAPVGCSPPTTQPTQGESGSVLDELVGVVIGGGTQTQTTASSSEGSSGSNGSETALNRAPEDDATHSPEDEADLKRTVDVERWDRLGGTVCEDGELAIVTVKVMQPDGRVIKVQRLTSAVEARGVTTE
jgi:hypothetical protein